MLPAAGKPARLVSFQFPPVLYGYRMTQSAAPRSCRFVKKLLPDAPGTKRLSERFGSVLVCVRYRVDAVAQRRYTTVELVVADGPLPPPPPAEVYVRVAYEEIDLRKKVKAAGGEWCRERRLWRLARKAARRLGPLRRIDRSATGAA